MAASTRASTMSRPRSCCSTISRRAAASDGVSMAGVGSSAREAVTANPTSRRANGPRHARRTARPLILVAAGDVVLVLLRRHQRLELVLVVELDLDQPALVVRILVGQRGMVLEVAVHR